jgi:hypothetical protein
MVWGVIAAVAGLVGLGPRMSPIAGAGDAGVQASTNGGMPVPILVELFTSEGCSSCPPADTLLTRLAREKTIGSAEIVTLAFHVDYWDRLGWKDRFSSAAFTERQNTYAAAWRSDRVYTPQAVVDGRVEFVGTDVGRALDALAEASRRPHARVSLTLGAVAGASPGAGGAARSLAVAVAPPAGASYSADVLLAVAEDGLSSQVTAGENASKRLEHTGVVRTLTRIGKIRAGQPLRLTPSPFRSSRRGRRRRCGRSSWCRTRGRARSTASRRSRSESRV